MIFLKLMVCTLPLTMSLIKKIKIIQLLSSQETHQLVNISLGQFDVSQRQSSTQRDFAKGSGRLILFPHYLYSRIACNQLLLDY